jgi:methionyl-tRNA formyltransferase
MSLFFLGSGPFAVPALEALARSRERPLLVVTRPDRPGGRGQRPTPTPVRVRAEELGLTVEAPASANDPGFIARLEAIRPDLIVVSDYGEILREPFFAVPRIGVFNLHASLLPRHRGAAPVAAALLAGDSTTGVTLCRIVRGLDRGPVVGRVATGISPEETAGELEARLARLAAELLEKSLPQLISGRMSEEPQDDSRATLAPKLPKGLGEIDWSLPPARLANFIRALSPRPGAYSFLRRREGKLAADPERIRFLRAREAGAPAPAGPDPHPGTVPPPPGTASAVEKHGFRVACGGGEVEILEIQPAGKEAMSASEFLRGHPLSPGDRFGPRPGSAPARPA